MGLGRDFLGTAIWGLWDWDAWGFGGGCGARRVPCGAMKVVEFGRVVIYEGLGGLRQWSLWVVGCRGSVRMERGLGGFGMGVSMGLGVLWDQ